MDVIFFPRSFFSPNATRVDQNSLIVIFSPLSDTFSVFTQFYDLILGFDVIPREWDA